jgi:hypothetical protein
VHGPAQVGVYFAFLCLCGRSVCETQRPTASSKNTSKQRRGGEHSKRGRGDEERRGEEGGATECGAVCSSHGSNSGLTDHCACALFLPSERRFWSLCDSQHSRVPSRLCLSVPCVKDAWRMVVVRALWSQCSVVASRWRRSPRGVGAGGSHH